MINLTIRNSYVFMTDVPWNVIQKIKEMLSYPDKQEQFLYKRRTGKFKSFRKYLCSDITDGISWPSGLLPLVLEYLDGGSVPYDVTDARRKPSMDLRVAFRKNGKLPPLRDYQTEIIKLALESERGIIEAATGTGKTRIMLELIYELGLPTLVIVPSINICKQTYLVLAEALEERHVGIVGGGKKDFKRNIVVATFQSLSSQNPEFFKKFQCVIVDEAHHSACETIQSVNNKFLDHMYYRYYLTATPFRNDGADIALAGVISTKKIHQYNFVEAHKDGHLVPPVFLFYPHEHVARPFKKGNYLTEYNALIVENEPYNRKVAEVAAVMRAKKRQILIFVKQIRQGEILREYIEGSVLLTGNETMAESEQILKDFEAKKFDVLIGTSVIGEGIDMKSVDCGIMAGGGRAKSDIMQKIGRLLRKHPGKTHVFVVDFTHTGVASEFNYRHALERHKVYQTYKTKTYIMKSAIS